MNFHFIQVASSMANLFSPKPGHWSSRPVAELEYNQLGSRLLPLCALPPLRAGETYNIRSSFNQPTVAAMRAAGTDYPDWVTERYLELPDSITPRTYQLAKLLEGMHPRH